jgi:hypothetical protein
MDTKRKGEIAVLFLKLKLRELLGGSVTLQWLSQNDRVIDLSRKLNAPKLTIAQAIFELRHNREPQLTRDELETMALVWITTDFVPSMEIRLDYGLRRRVGSTAKSIGITTEEALEFLREVLIDVVREVLGPGR